MQPCLPLSEECTVYQATFTLLQEAPRTPVPCSRTFQPLWRGERIVATDVTSANLTSWQREPPVPSGSRDQTDNTANWVAPLPLGQLTVSPESECTDSLISPNDRGSSWHHVSEISWWKLDLAILVGDKCKSLQCAKKIIPLLSGFLTSQ